MKFDRVLEFGGALPRLRRQVAQDLALRGLVRERVLACAIRLLDLGFFRIGSEQYTLENDTYGLAPLRQRHLKLERGKAVFDYPAKGGQRHVQVVTDPIVLPTLRALKRRRRGGRNLLVYWHSRQWVRVRSGDINGYLEGAAGGEFTAKDFPTWNATVLAAVALGAEDGQPPSAAARKRAATQAVKQVAGYLFNTPAVCRRSYIDPRTFDTSTPARQSTAPCSGSSIARIPRSFPIVSGSSERCSSFLASPKTLSRQREPPARMGSNS